MTGSPDRSEQSAPNLPERQIDDLVAVGRVRRPTGIDGTLLVEVYSGDPDRFANLDAVIVDAVSHDIVETGKSGRSAKIKLEGVDTIEQADLFRDSEVFVTADTLPANPPGVYYHYEILGLKVVTNDGTELGTLSEIIETGSNDVFVVSSGKRSSSKKRDKKSKSTDDILIPVLDGLILNVDAESGVMTIDPPGGLF